MANASARRSFHGPFTAVGRPRARAAHPAREATPARSPHPLELVPAPPSESSIGRELLAAARAEQPTTSERQRILASVLAALQNLTGTKR